jgi:hypothetical protein
MRKIKASFTDKTIRVYQAYGAHIALPALRSGRFIPPFSMNRMTWIKPSFNWMMYRCGYASKPGQEMVLAIDITREGFDWALDHSVLAQFDAAIHASHDEWQSSLQTLPVRVQWDPERDWRLVELPGDRAIQIGLSGEAVELYVNQWITRIVDVTDVAHQLEQARAEGKAPDNLPDKHEAIYPVSDQVRSRLGMD